MCSLMIFFLLSLLVHVHCIFALSCFCGYSDLLLKLFCNIILMFCGRSTEYAHSYVMCLPMLMGCMSSHMIRHHLEEKRNINSIIRAQTVSGKHTSQFTDQLFGTTLSHSTHHSCVHTVFLCFQFLPTLLGVLN